jgi:hypothetical protein
VAIVQSQDNRLTACVLEFLLHSSVSMSIGGWHSIQAPLLRADACHRIATAALIELRVLPAVKRIAGGNRAKARQRPSFKTHLTGRAVNT